MGDAQQSQDPLGHAEDLVSKRSHEIRLEHADTFAEDAEQGVILVGIDKSHGRNFLGQASASKVRELTGADLSDAIRTTKLLHHLHVLTGLALVILSGVVFGLWALAVLPGLFVAWTLGVNSNVVGGGGFSILVALGFLVSTLAADSGPQIAWSLAGAVWAGTQRAIYRYPVGPLRAAVVSHPVLREMLVDLHVLVLKYPD